MPVEHMESVHRRNHGPVRLHLRHQLDIELFVCRTVGVHLHDVLGAANLRTEVCGGTLAKLVRQGFRVGIIDLTDGEPTPKSPGPEVRLREAAAAAEALGVNRRVTLDLPNRRLFDSFEARGEAFRACEYMIDTLKTDAPFWKKEATDSGNRWVSAPPVNG